jgi:predicted deacylase
MRDKRLPILVVIGLSILILGGSLWLLPKPPPPAPAIPSEIAPVPINEPLVSSTTIGTSVEGRPITAYQFGTGKTPILFVGGIHGGYEWNTVVLAYEMIDYFTTNLYAIPENLTIHIIPNANPDGLALVTGGRTGRISAADITAWSADGRGRFNANGVDLNRNFDCKWSPDATWRGRAVGAGSAPFSEPEAAALRDYIIATSPVAGVFWHSVANAVYGSECHEGILPLTLEIMNRYATAARYAAVPAFTAYPVVGDVEGWLATFGIAAITVELETRENSEWNRNLAGTLAVIEYIRQIDTVGQ